MIKFCSLYSGSSGNAIFLSDGRTKILIDAGLSGKRIFEALTSIGEDPNELDAILVSHEHSDHVRGVGVISRRINIPIYANKNTWEAMERSIGPIVTENRMCFDTGKEFEIGGININAFLIPHDAAEPVGFNFFVDNSKITTLTDIGCMSKDILCCIEGSDLVLLESNHDTEMLKVGPYPWYLKKRIMGDRGHLSNESAGEVVAYLAKMGTRHFLLGHLSRENNFPELAYETVRNILDGEDIDIERDITLMVAQRDRAGEVINIG